MEFLKFPPWSMFSINPHIIPCAFRPDLLFALVTFHQFFIFPLSQTLERFLKFMITQCIFNLSTRSTYLPYLTSNTFLFFYYCLFIQFQIQGFVKLGKRKVLNESYLKEMVMPQSGELFGRVIKLVGGDNIIVKSSDGRIRTCRIRGKIKRKMWIRDNDLVLIAPWDFQSDKADIIWRYISAHADKLEQDGLLQGLR
jgi:translation initiation factor 1A